MKKTIVFKFKIKSIVLVSMGTGVQLRVRVRVFVCVCAWGRGACIFWRKKISNALFYKELGSGLIFQCFVDQNVLMDTQ